MCQHYITSPALGWLYGYKHKMKTESRICDKLMTAAQPDTKMARQELRRLHESQLHQQEAKYVLNRAARVKYRASAFNIFYVYFAYLILISTDRL